MRLPRLFHFPLQLHLHLRLRLRLLIPPLPILLAALLSACATNTPSPNPPSSAPATVVVESFEGIAGGDYQESVELDDLLADDKITTNPRARTIYFAYDSAAISETDRAIIEAHARYLNENPNLRITLAGHTDERGTREYNLALSEERAIAVAALLSSMRVASLRMQTVGYGEERPVAFGSNEAAWRKNRRVEITYR